ncbi:MAG: hypothetical protein H6Q19_2120 [Bacteroidetes bacterium]|nr:hypothetical protein [Bacteroidota bacterium]
MFSYTIIVYGDECPVDKNAIINNFESSKSKFNIH